MKNDKIGGFFIEGKRLEGGELKSYVDRFYKKFTINENDEIEEVMEREQEVVKIMNVTTLTDNLVDMDCGTVSLIISRCVERLYGMYKETTGRSSPISAPYIVDPEKSEFFEWVLYPYVYEIMEKGEQAFGRVSPESSNSLSVRPFE